MSTHARTLRWVNTICCWTHTSALTLICLGLTGRRGREGRGASREGGRGRKGGCERKRGQENREDVRKKRGQEKERSSFFTSEDEKIN